MTNELKPCPFCGGEAEIKYSEWTDSCDPSERHHVWSVGCAKQATRDYCCPGRLCMNRGLKNRDEAIEAWNTRAERTCHIDVFDNLAETEGNGDVWLECSACGWQMDYAEAPSMPLKYCPNCGALVEKGDA